MAKIIFYYIIKKVRGGEHMFNYSFNVAAILVFILIIFVAFYKKMYVLKTTRLLIIASVLSILSCVLEVIFVFTNNDDLNTFYLTLYIWLRNIIYFCILDYTIYSLRADVYIKKNKWLYSSLIPLFSTLICFIINLFSRNIFYVHNQEIIKGTYSWLIYVIVGYYIVFSFITLFTSWTNFVIKKNKLLIIVIFSISITILVQVFFCNFFFEMFAISLFIGIILLTIERKEDIIANGLKCSNKKLFLTDMKIYYNYGIPFNVIVIKINEFKGQKTSTSQKQLEAILNKFITTLDNSLNLYQLEHHTYYLNDGVFSVSFKKKPDDIKKILLSTFENKWVNDIGLQDICVLSVDSVSDIKSYDTFIDVCLHMEDYITFTKDNNFVIYNEYALDNKILLDISYPELIQTAIDEDKFEVFYQPIYNCSNKSFSQGEALLRLRTSEGYMFPSKLIEISEKNHNIEKVTNIVFEKVCKFVSSDDFKKLNLNFIEINVSSYEIVKKSFSDRIIEISNKYNINPKKICFDITEKASLIDEEIFFKNMARLISYGFNFCLDGYGYGYSSITRMMKYPINIIKFDKSFISHEDDKDMKSIVASHINMLKDINKDILIGGVETKESVDYFISLGVNYLQGYYYSLPLKEDEFVTFILDNNISKD